MAGTALAALSISLAAAAAPSYTVTKTIVAQDQYTGESTMIPAPIYKPHDARATYTPNFWMTSNERTGCAGITTLESGTDKTLANVIIDEPGVAYASGDAELGGRGKPCVGTLSGTEPPEGQIVNWDPQTRMNPQVCLPVVLPPGAPIPSWQGVPAKKGPFPNTICAPLGAEMHPRHPHGLTYDGRRNRVYQVIEHAGLRWNANRTAFQVADTTDEESGLTLTWDVSNPRHPVTQLAYLNGHAAHEIVVNQRTGTIWQGNHEQSPGVKPSIWVDVIDPTRNNPYGFIDTGYFDAIQGVDYLPIEQPLQDTIFGVTHVGEKMFAFNAYCRPQPNPPGVVPPPAPPGYSLPSGDTNMQMGWNCIKYWVDLRPAFLSQVPNAAQILGIGVNPGAPPNVLHFHNLAVNSWTGTAYMALHAIHDAEHTGLDDEPPSGDEEEGGESEHVMGRWVAAVGAPTEIDPVTKQATAPVTMIDLSHGYDALHYPNAEDVQARLGVSTLLKSFVHAHFLAVDPVRHTVLVSGEHTGNLGVIDEDTETLQSVVPISRSFPGCLASPLPGQITTGEEPHVHGVTLQRQTGTVYVSDEGEHCWYELVRELTPSK